MHRAPLRPQNDLARHSGTAAMLTGCEPFTRDRTHKWMYQEFDLWIFVAFTKKKNMCLNFELPNIPWFILNHHETSIHHYPSIKKKENHDFLHIKTVKTPKSCLLVGLVDLLGKPLQQLMQSRDCWAAPITGILRYAMPAPCGISINIIHVCAYK